MTHAVNRNRSQKEQPAVSLTSLIPQNGSGIATFAPGMFSSIRQDWATPWRLFEILNREFRFDLDVCAGSAEESQCDMYFSPKEDSLATYCMWRRRCWMNPPYGRHIGDWVEKAYRSALLGERIYCEHIVCLLPARTDTSWWHDYCLKGEVRFLRGRLTFDDVQRKRAPFPSAIVIFRAAKEEWDSKGQETHAGVVPFVQQRPNPKSRVVNP